MVNYPRPEEVISEAAIIKRVKELGKVLTKDYDGKDLLTVSILKGSVIFTADLVREIDLPLEMAFMAVSSYGSGLSSSGSVNIRYDVDRPVAEKDVLIIEDVVDTGLTIAYLKNYFSGKGAASIKVCSLFDKPSRRKTEVKADYIGFEIENDFVVGYGLDADNMFRNLRNLCRIKV